MTKASGSTSSVEVVVVNNNNNNTGGGGGGGVDDVDVKVVEQMRTVTGWRVKHYDVLLRSLGLLFTLAAAIIVGVDKETKVISYAADLQFTATAKWEYMSAIVFLLVSNAIGCTYAAISLVISLTKNGNKTALSIVTVLDLAITALLFSANGAGSAVGVLGEEGNSHAQWIKVCNMFDAYCRQMSIALILSLFASILFLLLVLLSLFKLHYRLT